MGQLSNIDPCDLTILRRDLLKKYASQFNLEDIPSNIYDGNHLSTCCLCIKSNQIKSIIMTIYIISARPISYPTSFIVNYKPSFNSKI